MSEKNCMDRRDFGKLLAAGGTALILPKAVSAKKTVAAKAKPLKPGSRIGIIAPATRSNERRLETAKANLESFGFKYFHTEKILDTHGNFAGTDAHRLSEIHRMYADSSIDAIWAIGGGYGTTRILDRLNFDLIKRNPKPLIGYSDITALLNTIHQKTGSPCFHAPVAASNYEGNYTRAMLAPLFGIKPPFKIPHAQENIERGIEDEDYRYKVITPGKAKGELAGGNLSLLVSLVGTKHAVDTKNKLVFIEDVGEAPYRVDRMLTHLISSGFFEKARGVVLGIFSDCKLDENDTESFDLVEVVTERMKQLRVPSVYGFSFGHIRHQCTLPIGVEAELDTEAKTLTLLKDAYK
ncbi:MAG: LD-carboxypeptidase [Pyrinomonadaceae bacterium]